MADIDHFKQVNDTYSHQAGDEVLRRLAGLLRAEIRAVDVVARYGGEEFSVVFTGKNSEDARPHLETLRQTIADTPFIVNRASRRKGDKKVRREKKRSVKVTVSIGVADSKAKAASPWDVLKFADKALYHAKAKGRNCVCN